MRAADRQMMWHGMFLFLVGLVTGLLQRRFTNMRMAVSAHLEGVMNGTFLVALGAIWANVKLPPRTKAAAYWTALYGTYANWLFTTLGAAFGTAAANPISSAGHTGKPWQEKVEAAGFLSVAVSIIMSSVLVIWGLRRTISSSETLVG
jgi:(hydroxyamino)benzene mutase